MTKGKFNQDYGIGEIKYKDEFKIHFSQSPQRLKSAKAADCPTNSCSKAETRLCELRH